MIYVAYPDGHTDAESAQTDIQHLKEKVDAGADFIVTQLFYDVEGFMNWQKKVREIGRSFCQLDNAVCAAFHPITINCSSL